MWMKILKRALAVLFIVDVIGFGAGYYVLKFQENEYLGTRITGFSVLGLFLVVMPIFLYIRYKGKDINKYLLTQDTIKKMREEADGRKI